MVRNPYPVNLGRFRFVDADGQTLTETRIEKAKMKWQCVAAQAMVHAPDGRPKVAHRLRWHGWSASVVFACAYPVRVTFPGSVLTKGATA